MKVQHSERFKKRYKKLPEKIKTKFKERIALLKKNPRTSLLKVHPLKGILAGFRAFSATGDYRVIYKITSATSIKLIDIGKHGKIYS